MSKIIEEIKNNLRIKDNNLSLYATKNQDALYLRPIVTDYRLEFFKDIDKIIHSLSYTRYIDKTQVFTFNDNDNLTKRIIHVQLVSKIARTIGRALNLNEDLIEAASLGHDLGHVPFGHVGEKILNDISLKHNEGYFNHNIQSVRTLLEIENKNISIQTLDAIMCHNGEFINDIYKPRKKTKEDFFNEYKSSYTEKDIIKSFVPMTMEGCVVRISDIIAYLGRDIEDAISLKLITKSDLPSNIINILGDNNKDIVNTIVSDIIENSYQHDYIKMSKKVLNAVKDLKDFNYKYIYDKANSKERIKKFSDMMNCLFDIYLKDIKNENKANDIYKLFLDNMSQDYINNTSKERMCIDFIAGITDDFLVAQFKKNNNL